MSEPAPEKKREPNPVWLREMRQAARLGRTPLILATLTAVTGLLVCSVGGIASSSTSPAEVGVVLFHTFFSLAFGVVAWIGPGVAASTIASERAGHTYESLILTGLSPREIANGKFLAALTYIGLYLVALAPVGALPFLFGGITPTEVLTAFLLLCVFAVLAVGFGLAVSSAVASPAVALLVTLPLAVFASLFAYFSLGVGLSMVAHELWPGVTQGAPVWLPTAYVRADFGLPYFIFLILLPFGTAGVLASFFYEVTVANLSDANDDRSTGIKRWFVLATAALVVLELFGVWLIPSDQWTFIVGAMGTCLQLSLFALFVLAGDPPGASRRTRAQWVREKASALRRFFGPGIARTAFLLVAVYAASETVLVVYGIAIEHFAASSKGIFSSTLFGTLKSSKHSAEMVLFALYSLAFFGFLCGLAVFLRSRPRGRFAPRVLIALVAFGACSLPLFVVAILTVVSHESSAYILAAPSPLFVFAMMGQASGGRFGLDDFKAIPPGFLAILGWAGLGLLLGLAGARRARMQEREQEATWKALDERIALEDARAAEAAE